jgi:crotonobetainyl-CoA:carnitine CoA-transferase CaiB-like acyl-CoA transferase
VSKVDAWAAKQPDRPVRSEAIRRLVELGLTIKRSTKPTNKAARSSRARDLAATAVEKMSDPEANPEVRNERRKMLIKGPSEFRKTRVDLPKRKS